MRWLNGLMMAAMVGGCASVVPEPQTPRLPPLVAHRGASGDAPENTMAAFRLALEQRSDAIETDCWLTKDGQIILIHDGNTRRTCGAPGLVVSESSFELLRELDAGRWKGEAFAGEKLPSLEECLAIIPPGKVVYIEVKCGPEIVPELVRQIRASKLRTSQVRVISFNDAVISEFKRVMPEVQAFLLYEFKKNSRGEWTERGEDLIRRAKTLGADGLDLCLRPHASELITPAFVQAAKAAGLSFHVWTLDDVVSARRAIELGAQSITTNRPGKLRDELP